MHIRGMCHTKLRLWVYIRYDTLRLNATNTYCEFRCQQYFAARCIKICLSWKQFPLLDFGLHSCSLHLGIRLCLLRFVLLFVYRKQYYVN